MKTSHAFVRYLLFIITSFILFSFHLSAQIAFAVGGTSDSTGAYGKIVKTTDGGISWQTMETFAHDFLYTIHFVNNSVGYVAGYNGLIMKTIDGGETWTVQNDSMPNVIISDIHFYDENIGGAVGSSGLLMTTVDGGQTWAQRDLGVFYYVSFIRYASPAVAYVGTDIYSGAIYKTTDAGETWAIDPTFRPAKYRVGEFISATTGIIYGLSLGNPGQDRSFYKTTDGGLTWTDSQIQNPEVGVINNMEFVNDTLGYFANYSVWNSQFYRSMDGGLNWQVDLNVPAGFFDYKFFNPNSGIAFRPKNDPKNEFYYTTDGGFNWQPGSVPDSSLHIRDLFVLLEMPTAPTLLSPANNARIVSDSVSFDWSEIYKPRQYHLQIATDLAFSNIIHEVTGLSSQLPIGGMNSGTYYWRVQATNHGSLQSQWSSPNKFHIQGVTGLENSENLPAKFALYPNFPNPFNPVTTIRFELANPERVNLVVYDISGQKVRTLVDGNKTAGQHEVSFDATNLPSGFYFYSITTGVFSATQRMILVK